jgi:hypothetical protein
MLAGATALAAAAVIAPLALTQFAVGSLELHSVRRDAAPVRAHGWALVHPEPAARNAATDAFSTVASLAQPDRVAGLQPGPRKDASADLRTGVHTDSRPDLAGHPGIDKGATFAERMAALVPLADPLPAVEPPTVAEAVPLPRTKPPVPAGEPTSPASAPRESGMRLVSVSSTPVPPRPERDPDREMLTALTRQVQPALSDARRDDITGSLSAYNNPGIPRARASESRTAVYDIATHTVHMPNGERLEAHSGLGVHFDDPSSRHLKMRGVTPPNVYELTPRERLFHGVAALRMTPIGADSMYGRNGILAHNYLLGPRGESNGCVSFKDYSRFLQAYRRGEVTRLLVVARLNGSPASAVARIRESDLRVAANGNRAQR